MKKYFYPIGLIGLFLATAGMAYVVYLGKLGFYWDEWPFLWFNHAFGQAGIIKYFDHNRPFWGYIYALTMPVLGTNIYAWQIFGLLGRVLSGLLLVWVVRLIWPERKWLATATGLLFILYPGFMQQSIALMYGHFWIVLNCFLISLGCMLTAIRSGRRTWLWLVVGLLTSAVNLFCMEYFFGLELLRPVILLIVLFPLYTDWRRRITRVVKEYLPYFLLTLLYIYWRVAVFRFPTYQPSGLGLSNPLQTVWQLIVNMLAGIWVAVGQAWTVIFHPTPPADFGPRSMVVYAILAVFSIILTVLFFRFIQSEDQKQSLQERLWPIWLSIPALVLAGIPFLVTGLTVKITYPSDRFTLPYMLGASLVLASLIDLISGKKIIRSVILAVFVGFSVGLHFMHANQYQQDWKFQNDFLWQLTWRAPAIEPGTVVITERLPHYFESDNSLTGPLNWTYAPDFTKGEMPFLMAFVSVRTETGVLSYDANQPIHQNYKVVDFYGNTSDSLVVWYNRQGCVRVLAPGRDAKLPGLPEELKYVLPNANLDLVLDGSSTPPAFLGKEPEHGWCYFFEKVDLAVSRDEWESAADLADQALALDENPNNPAERLVLAEAYAMTGKWQKAKTQTDLALAGSDRLQRMVCSTWNRISANTTGDDQGKEIITAIRQSAGCE